MMNNSFIQPGISAMEIDTPAIMLDMNAAESNILRMQEFCDENGIGLRPHTKTNKSPFWAWKQMNAGAIGICCAKSEEAEIMAGAGLPEIMIPNQIITPVKITRLMAVASTASVIVAVDSGKNVEDLAEASEFFKVDLGVVIEINVGLNRCGVEPDSAAKLAEKITRSKRLRFDGVIGYEGHVVSERDFEVRKAEATNAMTKLMDAVISIRNSGIPVNIVSAAGTGTYNITGKIEGITEIQPGSYIFMDGDYLQVFRDFTPAMTVISTVIARNGNDHAVLDCGLKSISTDRGVPYAVQPKGVEILGLSEEHTRVRLSGDAKELRLGDKVQLRPMHGDTTINIHENYFGVRNGILEVVIPIAGRGKFH